MEQRTSPRTCPPNPYGSGLSVTRYQRCSSPIFSMSLASSPRRTASRGPRRRRGDHHTATRRAHPVVERSASASEPVDPSACRSRHDITANIHPALIGRVLRDPPIEQTRPYPAAAAWPAGIGLVMVPNCSRWPARLRRCDSEHSALGAGPRAVDGTDSDAIAPWCRSVPSPRRVVLGVEALLALAAILIQRMRLQHIDTLAPRPFGQSVSCGVKGRRPEAVSRTWVSFEIQCMTSDSVDQCGRR